MGTRFWKSPKGNKCLIYRFRGPKRSRTKVDERVSTKSGKGKSVSEKGECMREVGCVSEV